MRYSFVCFTYDTDDGCFVGEHRLRLSRMECRVLGCLVGAAGRVVTKNRLAEQAWGGGPVSDESIARAIHMLRRKLRAHSDEPCVETVYSHGYRLMPPVRRIAGVGAPIGPGTATSLRDVTESLRDLRETLRRGAPTDPGRMAQQVERVERLLAEFA